jgi:hypothetical protein
MSEQQNDIKTVYKCRGIGCTMNSMDQQQMFEHEYQCKYYKDSHKSEFTRCNPAGEKLIFLLICVVLILLIEGLSNIFAFNPKPIQDGIGYMLSWVFPIYK